LAFEVLDEDILFEGDVVVFGALEQGMEVVVTDLAGVDLVGTQDAVVLVFHEEEKLVVHLAQFQGFH
jgi:hypothetical protein